MDYKKTCPYCYENVTKIVNTNDYDTSLYHFSCKCVQGTGYFNEHMAYQEYLEQREIKNLTNFDKYFNNTNIYEIEEEMNKWCERINGKCEKCIYARIVNLLGYSSNDCWYFID